MRIFAFATAAIVLVALSSACSSDDVPPLTLDDCQRPGLTKDAIFYAESELGSDWASSVRDAYALEFGERNISQYQAAALSHYIVIKTVGAAFPKGTSWRCHLLISAENFDAVGDIMMREYDDSETAEAISEATDLFREIVRSHTWDAVADALNWIPPAGLMQPFEEIALQLTS